MPENFPQYVANAAAHPASAVGSALGTLGTVVSTYLEVLTPVIGALAMLVGLVVTTITGFLAMRNYIQKWSLMEIEKDLAHKEIELKDAQIAAIDERKKSRE